jgi:anti-sigma factor RsiW
LYTKSGLVFRSGPSGTTRDSNVSNAMAMCAGVLGSCSLLRAQRSLGRFIPPVRLRDSNIQRSSADNMPAPLRRFSLASAMKRQATPRCSSDGYSSKTKAGANLCPLSSISSSRGACRCVLNRSQDRAAVGRRQVGGHWRSLDSIAAVEVPGSFQTWAL